MRISDWSSDVCSSDLRPVRFQLELLKPEVLLDEANIGSTFVFYGSARIPAPQDAQALLDAAASSPQRRLAVRLAAKAHYYTVAHKLVPHTSECDFHDAKRPSLLCSRGGPLPIAPAQRHATSTAGT